MVLMALWQRVDQYGVAERRYLMGVLALWLGGAALYAAITRTGRIRWIPLTLAVLGLVTFAGPWSAYAVAEGSQAKRLEAILDAHGALAGGRVAAGTVEIPFDDWNRPKRWSPIWCSITARAPSTVGTQTRGCLRPWRARKLFRSCPAGWMQAWTR